MLFVKNLSAEIKLTLENMYKNHPNHSPRMRAHAVLLSNEGYSIKELSDTFGVCRQTTATWLHSWEKNSICGLLDDLRSGRPCKLFEENKHKVLEQAKQFPRSLKKVLAFLAEELNIKLSCSTLKRLCKQAKLCWKRVRTSLRTKRDPELFAQSQQQLAALVKQAEQKQIDRKRSTPPPTNS